MVEFDLATSDADLLAQVERDLAPLMSGQIADFYEQLKSIAARERLRSVGNPSLNTTALVNELFVKFARNRMLALADPKHFLALCAIAMRNLLVDRARSNLRAADFRSQLDTDECDPSNTVLVVHDALEKLAQAQPRLARVVECRWFAGYSELETASALGVTDRTVRRDWEKAQMWLKVALSNA